MLAVSTAGYYEWRDRAPSARAVGDQALGEQIAAIHALSRGTQGSPRVHAELRLGRGLRCGRKRVARLMRSAGLQEAAVGAGDTRGRLPQCMTISVQRRFVADAPDRLSSTDITEHPTREGKVYCAAALDVYSRPIVGWSIADHVRTELVVDALEMARWRRQPPRGETVVHSDRGSQYTSWAFGHRLRAAGLLSSIGRVASAVDHSMMAARATRYPHLAYPGGARIRHLRVDRGLASPAPASYLGRRSQPRRLRKQAHHRRGRGMMSTRELSGEAGQAPSTRFAGPSSIPVRRADSRTIMAVGRSTPYSSGCPRPPISASRSARRSASATRPRQPPVASPLRRRVGRERPHGTARGYRRTVPVRAADRRVRNACWGAASDGSGMVRQPR